MNWLEIKKKYPNAYKVFFEYSNKQSPQKFNRGNLWPGEEHLYGFFDKQEIMGHLEFHPDEQLWIYWILQNEGGRWSGGGGGGWDAEERIIAEKFMFKKIFEILENKLT